MQHHHPWSRVLRLAAPLALKLSVVACASVEEEQAAPARAAAGGAVNAGGVAAGTPGPSGGRAGSGGSTLQLGGSETAPPPTATEVCQGETYEGKLAPVDLYFLVDSSSSMAERVAGGTKWEVLSRALSSFLSNLPATQGSVGLGFFPRGTVGTCTPTQPGCACIPFTRLCAPEGGDSCNPADYQPSTELSLLSDAARVVGDLGAHQLSGGTPTRPAVEGALQYLEQWAASHPDRRVALVLATDGEPTGCDRNGPEDIAELTAKAWSGANAVRTFVLGVGSLLTSLDTVAQAGGTQKALLVDTSGNLAQQLTDALEKIRSDSTVACEFTIPRGAEGKEVDPTKVNILAVTTGGASSIVSQTFMSDPNRCDVAGGWYYDDPALPTKIKLCESTCQQLQRGSIQIQYGCDTVVRPPH
jgi:hypothetical protein